MFPVLLCLYVVTFNCIGPIYLSSLIFIWQFVKEVLTYCKQSTLIGLYPYALVHEYVKVFRFSFLWLRGGFAGILTLMLGCRWKKAFNSTAPATDWIFFST